jgi:hypothetical protein
MILGLMSNLLLTSLATIIGLMLMDGMLFNPWEIGPAELPALEAEAWYFWAFTIYAFVFGYWGTVYWLFALLPLKNVSKRLVLIKRGFRMALRVF